MKVEGVLMEHVMYVKPQMEVIGFNKADIIVTSGGMQGGDGDILGGDWGPSVPLG